MYRAMWVSGNMIVDHKRLTGRLEDGEVELCVFTEVNCVIPSDFSLCRLLTGCYAIMLLWSCHKNKKTDYWVVTGTSAHAQLLTLLPDCTLCVVMELDGSPNGNKFLLVLCM